MTNITPGKTPFVIDNVLYNRDADVVGWINNRLAEGQPKGMNIGDLVDVPFVALGVIPEGEDAGTLRFIAGAYFFNYEPTLDIWMAVAADTAEAGHPKILARVLDYPFRALDLPRLSVQIAEGNTRAIRQAEKLGFVIEGRPRGKGVVYMGLLRADALRLGFWKPDLPQAA